MRCEGGDEGWNDIRKYRKGRSLIVLEQHLGKRRRAVDSNISTPTSWLVLFGRTSEVRWFLRYPSSVRSPARGLSNVAHLAIVAGPADMEWGNTRECLVAEATSAPDNCGATRSVESSRSVSRTRSNNVDRAKAHSCHLWKPCARSCAMHPSTSRPSARDRSRTVTSSMCRDVKSVHWQKANATCCRLSFAYGEEVRRSECAVTRK